jgi:hypothetical protein
MNNLNGSFSLSSTDPSHTNALIKAIAEQIAAMFTPEGQLKKQELAPHVEELKVISAHLRQPTLTEEPLISVTTFDFLKTAIARSKLLRAVEVLPKTLNVDDAELLSLNYWDNCIETRLSELNPSNPELQ